MIRSSIGLSSMAANLPYGSDEFLRLAFELSLLGKAVDVHVLCRVIVKAAYVRRAPEAV